MKKNLETYKEYFKIKRPKNKIKRNMKFYIKKIEKWISF